MAYLYLGCLIFSIGMLLWLKIYDVRNSVTQFISLLIMCITNLGFYMLAISTTLEEAVLAQKIAYVGGAFLPLFYLLMVFEICHIKINRFVEVALIMMQSLVFTVICFVGKNNLFYENIHIYIKGGTTILGREYGPLHFLYPLTLFGYLMCSYIVIAYSLIKRKVVDRKGVLAMATFSGIVALVYVAEKATHLEYEIVPLVYVVLMLGALIPVYDSNLFTVYENTTIINEQLNKIGFLTFDINMIYKGCNGFMAGIFPELEGFLLGQKIEGGSEQLYSVINQIDNLDDIYEKGLDKAQKHIDVEPFLLGDKYYAGLIHGVYNTFGKLKGYTIELRDDTEHYKALRLREHYNEELAGQVEEKTRRIRHIQQKIIMGMAQMVESRDYNTGGHIKRTSEVVRIFANKLLEEHVGLDKAFLNYVIRSAPMHDLGKIGVSDNILHKQGRFTDEEYAQMKKHSEIGYQMVKEILSDVEEVEFVKVAENVARYHHEKVDGSGYPAGIKADEIPIEARIMALADVFDALVSKRCYKDAYSYDKAFDIIKQESGTHFDKELAAIFLLCREQLEEYYEKTKLEEQEKEG